jgi:GalNAc-alpha-(1->4)-GalNAc-alpha-(1->3)-diNAcBac-PP-undecaprenol alpha-1,4-N-acetyl-D-galactosaminyltransferase
MNIQYYMHSGGELNKEMKSLMIITSSLQGGGIERASSNLANAFSDKGIKVFFLCIFNHPHFFNINTNIMLLEPKSAKFQRLNILFAPLRIREYVKKLNPDAILAFNKFYGALSISGIIGLNIPIYISERASPLYRFPLLIRIFNYVQYSLFRPSGVIAQTEFATQFQKSYYKKGTKIVVINNALRDIQVYDIPKKHYVLAVGRLNDYLKGFDLLLESWAKVKKTGWKLVLAGNDNNAIKLKNQAKKLGLLENLIFLGEVKDIDRVYAESDIFVIPSRSEGFPNALIEAMAAGLSCISFDFKAGPAEIIKNGYNGILVKEGDLTDLASKIDFLMENESERVRLGENAKLIRSRLANDIISKKFLEFIFNGEY